MRTKLAVPCRPSRAAGLPKSRNPLDRSKVRWISMTSATDIPSPVLVSRQDDIVLLRNLDQLQGFVISRGDGLLQHDWNDKEMS